MRSTKTRLSAVFVTLLLTVGIVAPAAAHHAPPHTTWQAWQDAEAALELVPNGNDHKDEREAAEQLVEETRAAFYDSGPEFLDKVTFCHAVGDLSDPYNQRPNVNPNSVVSEGHGGHDGPVFDPTMTTPNSWGDIIPEFFYSQGNQVGYYPGLNWDDAGKAVWEADCVVETDDGDDGDPLPVDLPTVTLEASEICEDEVDGIQIHLDNPTDGAVTFSGTLSQDDSDLASGSHTVPADSEYLFEATAPAAGAYEIEWEARDGNDELLASDSFSITVDPCSDPDPQTYPVLPIKGWFFEGLDTDEVPTGYATVEVSYDDGDELSGSEQYRVEIGEPLLPVTDGPGELGDGVLSISLAYDGDAVAAPLDVPTTIDLGDVTIAEVDYEVAGFECTASYPDPGEVDVPPGQVQTLSELDGPVVPFPWLLEIGEDVQLLPVLNTCVADTETGGSGGNGNDEDDDVPVGNPTVYELDVDAQEVCLPDDLREVIVLELDGRNVTSADIELQDADGNTLDTVTNLNLNASPHQLDWPVDDDGQLYAEVTVVITSPQRVQLDIEPIVVNLADEALADCTEVGGIVDENPEPQPEPEPQPQPEPGPGPEPQPQPQPQPVVDDEVEVRDVVIEREVPVARGQLPRTGATTVALVMTGLLSLLTGGALLRSGRREEDAS